MSIRSRAELRAWMKQDLEQYRKNGSFPGSRWHWWHGLQFPVIGWQRTLRRTEYVTNTWTGTIWRPYVLLWKAHFLRSSIRLNLEIPLHVFGPGLTVAHYANIVVNPDARAGANCRIHPGALIGESKDKCPVIGDDVYIGNGAIVVGGVRVGNRVKIGPHALVRESLEDGEIVVGNLGKKITRPSAEDGRVPMRVR